ncbi:cysteine desulfurase family protein [Mechercharimyces sp. CAU 1602]|uniref:cysteine desulfurase family protein n=1 Tax=Mechercharimyces sp. CAU 1602 TaxID=2973933 RepID=UPI002161F8DD|nr:cysteine desulfurase family protein [Mechercharimyces sp. CAU 1602]MCS1350006.1 cysteine desulfurase [Mechercharimyces sp. CAU 1602]
MKSIYLDYGATAPVRKEVQEIVMHCLQHEFANGGSLHDPGQAARDRIEWARSQVATSIGADAREIIFTSGGTEANNLAVLGAARKHRHRGNHIITSQVEHPAILECCRALEKEGFDITYLPVNRYGQVETEKVKEAITPNTILVSVMAANNEVGSLNPIATIGELLREKGILFHVDAIQWVGKLPLDLSLLSIDLLSIASHKIYGPKGVGALYIRKGVRIEPIMYGGGQERGLRPSTQNVPGIVGFGLAAELISQEVTTEAARLTQLRDTLWKRISSEIKDVCLNGHPTDRLPNNINVSFDRVEGQAVMLELNRHNIFISSGSACSAGKHAPSHVLIAMGHKAEDAHQSLRITLGRETTREDLDLLVGRLHEVITYMRSLI